MFFEQLQLYCLESNLFYARIHGNVKIEHFSHFHDISYGHNTLIVRSINEVLQLPMLSQSIYMIFDVAPSKFTLCDERVDLTGLQLIIISARYVGELPVNAL